MVRSGHQEIFSDSRWEAEKEKITLTSTDSNVIVVRFGSQAQCYTQFYMVLLELDLSSSVLFLCSALASGDKARPEEENKMTSHSVENKTRVRQGR